MPLPAVVRNMGDYNPAEHGPLYSSGITFKTDAWGMQQPDPNTVDFTGFFESVWGTPEPATAAAANADRSGDRAPAGTADTIAATLKKHQTAVLVGASALFLLALVAGGKGRR